MFCDAVFDVFTRARVRGIRLRILAAPTGEHCFNISDATYTLLLLLLLLLHTDNVRRTAAAARHYTYRMLYFVETKNYSGR